MTGPARQNGGKRPKGRTARRQSVRAGGTHLRLFNSGLEVWLYDDANADAIRASGALDFIGGSGRPPTATFEDLTKQGVVVGYGLEQDDELEIAVYVGGPLTDLERSASRWLGPQTAFLRLPSGKLCVEPNDALRVGAETPTDTGGVVPLPPGDYRVTLYRVDHEALFRERREWKGPQQVIVLTPGGSPADAAGDLLPFENRRDTSWVGKYEIRGNRAAALAWFDDYWDTCVVNLDSAAIAKLAIVPGAYLRIHAPAPGVTLVSAFARSWNEAARLPLPSGVPLDEYGYAALSPMGEWDGAEALFCRREKATTRIEAEHHAVWTEATVEVLDPAEHPPQAPKPKAGGFAPSDLAAKEYFDPGFLTLILSDVLPGVDDLDELPLAQALEMLDEGLGKTGLVPQGDLEWVEENLQEATERACRLYTGQRESFGAVKVSEGSIDVLLVSELEDGRWIVTGLADDFESRVLAARHRGVANEGVRIESIDDALKTIVAGHAKALRAAKAKPVTAPDNLEECAAAFQRLLTAALG